MVFRALAPNPVHTKLITLLALVGVVLITYCCLFAGVILKLRGDLPQPGLLYFLKNHGAILYAIPVLFLITSRAMLLIQETGGVVRGWRKLLTTIFLACWVALFSLPVAALLATAQGCSITFSMSQDS